MTSSREITFTALSPFIDALVSSGVVQAVAAVVDEKRTVETAPGVLSVEHVNVADFLAYRDSTIFKLTVHGELIPKAEEIIRSHGITVTRRDRNITR